MVFNSVVFLFGFLPLVLLLYYLVPGKLKNAVLLLESLAFYCWTGVQYLPLIVFLVVFNYIWGGVFYPSASPAADGIGAGQSGGAGVF